MKDVIANRFSMCTLELNDVVLVFDVVVMQKYVVVLRIQNVVACDVGTKVEFGVVQQIIGINGL